MQKTRSLLRLKLRAAPHLLPEVSKGYVHSHNVSPGPPWNQGRCGAFPRGRKGQEVRTGPTSGFLLLHATANQLTESIPSRPIPSRQFQGHVLRKSLLQLAGLWSVHKRRKVPAVPSLCKALHEGNHSQTVPQEKWLAPQGVSFRNDDRRLG